HSHVSPLRAPSSPPKRTVTPRRLSYAIAWPMRGEGPSTAFSVQEAPSHSQVPRVAPESPDPPKTTVTPRPPSDAMPWSWRGLRCCSNHPWHDCAIAVAQHRNADARANARTSGSRNLTIRVLPSGCQDLTVLPRPRIADGRGPARRAG